MTRGAFVVTLASLVAGVASTQEAPPVLDVPAGPAAIRGRVLHSVGDSAVQGVDVVLYALTAGGVPGVRRTTSGADGAFAFEGIANDPETAYLVGVRYRDVPFPGQRILFEPGQQEARVDVRVSEPTADASRVQVVRSTLRIDRAGDRLVVRETHRLFLPGEATAYVPPARRQPGRAGFRATLPAGAREFQMPFGVVPEGVERKGAEVAFYGPFYPGEHDVRFSYELPASGGTLALRKRFPSGARDVRLLTALGSAAALTADGLRETGEVELDGRTYREYEAGGLDAGASLALRVQLPAVASDLELLRLVETRIFLEIDDAALTAREEHRFAVEGEAPLAAPEGGVALELTLPDGAQEIRFSPNALDLGLIQDGGASARLRGPLPPGESTVELLYRVPTREGAVRLERRFGKRLPLLTVFLADTGVVAESDRLHRRRPVRTPDRAFLHLEAFEVDPAETVALRVAPIPPRTTLPRGLRIGIVALVAAGLVWFLIGPLGARDAHAQPAAAEERPHRHRDEREAIYAAIRDLEHDREMDKVSEADYQALLRSLRARAVALLRREREEEAATEHEGVEPEAPRCAACGAEGRRGDRFCAQCGSPLATAAATERGAAG